MYSYCFNICLVLKRQRNATFGAHRLARKIFSHSGSNQGPKKINQLLRPLGHPDIPHALRSQHNIVYTKKVWAKNQDSR